MTLTIDQLFTPSTAQQWLASILGNMTTVQLQTTAWQSAGQARTILAIMANLFAIEDAAVSGMAQGGFLDFAATGSVTYVTSDGTTVTTPVTPDPSIPSQNPTGAAGWLDVLADSVYDVQRIGAERASGTIAAVNTSANTYGPYAAGGYHTANPTTAATYANTTSLTITPSPAVGTAITAASNTAPIQITTSAAHGLTTGQVVYVRDVLGNTAANGLRTVTVTSATQFTLDNSSGNGAWTSGGTVLLAQTFAATADVAGPTGTSARDQITQAVTSATGVVVTNTTAFFGAAFESNTALAARCRARIQALSPGGPAGAYRYFALAAYQLLLDSTPPVILTAPVSRVSVQVSTVTGVVTVAVASANGAVPGVVQLPITAATNASPIVLTTGSAHGLGPGDYVTVSGALGNTAANGTWVASAASGTSVTLTGSTGNGTYTGGGSIEGGDLGHVDRVIQANAVPDGITESTITATAWNVAIVASVVVPQAHVAAYTANAQTALALYFASLPIGGSSGGVLQYNDIVGLLWAAGSVNGALSYVSAIPSLTVNGTAANASYPGASYVATLSPAPLLTVSGT
jgi:hypothetical protein